jgi:hypothetical protein
MALITHDAPQSVALHLDEGQQVKKR